MAEYWVRVTFDTEQPVHDVLRLAADVARMVEAEVTVAVTEVEVQRWDDDDYRFKDVQPPSDGAKIKMPPSFLPPTWT